MLSHGNMILDKRTKQWTVQRIRTKQGHIVEKRIFKQMSPGVSSSKRRAYRKYAHRNTIHLDYARCKSLGV
jgi:hypothetical protein